MLGGIVSVTSAVLVGEEARQAASISAASANAVLSGVLQLTCWISIGKMACMNPAVLHGLIKLHTCQLPRDIQQIGLKGFLISYLWN